MDQATASIIAAAIGAAATIAVAIIANRNKRGAASLQVLVEDATGRAREGFLVKIVRLLASVATAIMIVLMIAFSTLVGGLVGLGYNGDIGAFTGGAAGAIISVLYWVKIGLDRRTK
jgi:hypothetical protein